MTHFFDLIIACITLLSIAGCDSKIIAIGDLHGDISNAIGILKMAKIIDDDSNWIGGRTTVIQVGDMVDRGPDGHGIIDLMIDLRIKAQQAGGELLNVIGNHEIMNLKGDWTFVDERDLRSHGNREIRAQEFSESGHYGKFIRSLPLVINKGSTLFTHGGLLKQFAVEGITKINKLGTEGLYHNLDAPILMNDGPVWTREIIMNALKGNCIPLRESLEALSKAEGKTINRMVIGHTAQMGGRMALLCENQLAAIDVYSSSYYAGGGWQTYLEITEDSNGNMQGWRQVGPIRVTQPPLSATKALSIPYANKTRGIHENVKQALNKKMESNQRAGFTTDPPVGAVKAANSNLLVIIVIVTIAGTAWWLLVLSPRRKLGLQKKTDTENV